MRHHIQPATMTHEEWREYRQETQQLIEEKKKHTRYQPTGTHVQKFDTTLRKYKLTYCDYKNMLNNQENKCAICKKRSQNVGRLHVDHSHVTGKNRGLLCVSCNTVLVKFHDSITDLQQAILYLQKYDL